MIKYKLTYVDGTTDKVEADESFDVDSWVLNFLATRNHPIDTLLIGPWIKFENRKMTKLFHFKVEDTNHRICKVEYSCEKSRKSQSRLSLTPLS